MCAVWCALHDIVSFRIDSSPSNALNNLSPRLMRCRAYVVFGWRTVALGRLSKVKTHTAVAVCVSARGTDTEGRYAAAGRNFVHGTRANLFFHDVTPHGEVKYKTRTRWFSRAFLVSNFSNVFFLVFFAQLLFPVLQFLK